MTRPLYDIARDIKTDIDAGNWPRSAQYAALPYLHAMGSLNSISDRYGCDTARGIVAYFLSNAAQWKGEKARKIKLELKALLALT